MKPAIKLILVLGMILFMTAACVSSPPPASPETPSLTPVPAANEATAAEAPAVAATVNAGSPAPDSLEVLAVMPAGTTVPAQVAEPSTVQPAPLPAQQPVPQPVQQPAQQPAPQQSPKQTTKPAPTQNPAAASPSPVNPPSPARPPAQTASAGQQKAKQVGEVVYTEGKVSVHRAGKVITTLDIGDVVYAYDVVMTGAASLAQVDLGSGRPGGAFIRLSENTAFYFDTKELSAEQRKTVLQLLSGSIAVKVEKLAGGSFSTVSDTAVLGVRGTEFVIDTIPDGSILVSCIEGAVAIQGPEGQTATAQPGRAVAGRETGLETAHVAVSELARFRSGWRQENFAGFASQAVKYSSGYAATLDTKRAAFDAALSSLRKQGATLSLWREAKDAGKVPRFTEWTSEKKAVGGVLFDSLKSLFLIERPYYRLLELKSLHESGTGVGTMQDGRSTTSFFNQFNARYGSLADEMAAVREALLLFAWASAGSPLGEFFGAKAESLGSGALFLNGDGW